MASNIQTNRDYFGTVIDIDDPTRSGRCKVRITELMDGVDDKDIPWASNGASTTFAGNGSGSLSVPKEGTTVRVRFNDNDIQAPEYFSVQKVDKNLVNEIKDDYKDTQVICYDHDKDMSIMYQPNSGIRIYLGGSKIQITPEGMITLEHAGETSIIQLNDKSIDITSTDKIILNSNSSVTVRSKQVNIEGTDSVNIKGDKKNECAVNGQALMTCLLHLATALDAKMPMSPGVNVAYIQSVAPDILNEKIHYT
jgi:hypothetical protein